MREECKTRHYDLRQILEKADGRWRTLESELEKLESSVQSKVLQRFSAGKTDLESSADDGPRNMGRHRLHTLVLLPLLNHMEKKVDWQRSGTNPKDGVKHDGTHLMAELSAYCDHVLDAIEDAAVADKNLDKTIKKTEKEEKSKGIFKLGMQDTKAVATLKRQRLSIWEAPRQLLDDLADPLLRLDAFVDGEMSPEHIMGWLSQAPSIALRSNTDWHFERWTAELDQLQKWWDTTKCALSGHAVLWDGLQNKEGLFIQRIEKGLEEVKDRKRRYSSFANFGDSPVNVANCKGKQIGLEDDFWTPKLEESMILLTQVLAEMRDALSLIRNSAMWRVVESGRQLQRELEEPPLLWDTVTVADGTKVVLARVEEIASYPDRGALGISEDQSPMPIEGDALDEMLIVTMNRLDCIIKISTEVRDFFSKDGLEHREDVFACGEAMSKIYADMNEELLAVLDDPSALAAQEWLEFWSQCDGSALAQGLEESLRSTPFKELSGEAFELRQKQLLLLRGLLALMDSNNGLRQRLVDALDADVSGIPRPAPEVKPGVVPLTIKKMDEISVLDALSSEPPLPSASQGSPEQFGCSIPQSARRLTNIVSPAVSLQRSTPTSSLEVSSLAQGSPVRKSSLTRSTSITRISSDIAAAELLNGASTSPWNGGATSSRPVSRGYQNSTPLASQEDLWNARGAVSPVQWSQKRMAHSNSQPSLRGPRGPRREEILREVRAPVMKFVEGERIPLRPSSSQTRLRPVDLSSSHSRLPLAAWS